MENNPVELKNPLVRPAPVQYIQPQPQPQGQGEIVRTREDIYALRHMEALKVLPPQKNSPWGAVSFSPSNVFFENQNPNEMIYVVVRKHWFTNLGWILANIFYSLLPLIIISLVVKFQINTSFITLRAFFIIILAYYSVIFTNVLRHF